MEEGMTPSDLIERIEAADEIWTGSKRQKEALRAKFGGRCAYCGNLLDKMHADHLDPVIRIPPSPWNGNDKTVLHRPERNVVSNMMPACAPCNLHKGGYRLEQWRDYLQRSADIVRKQTSTFRAGERFGVITVSDAPIIFYFEKVAKAHQTKGDASHA
jgi:5-methylcytosine-specific restriction endonuclease McrA